LTLLISLTMRVGTKKFWVPRQVLATLLALAAHTSGGQRRPSAGRIIRLAPYFIENPLDSALRDFGQL
jgi:hypothetical protein